MIKYMKKEDLKPGMVLETNAGLLLLIVELDSSLFNLTNNCITKLYLSDFNDKFVCKYNAAERFKRIVKIYKDYTLRESLYEYVELPKLTNIEKIILKNINKEYKYIARGKGSGIGHLYLFKEPSGFENKNNYVDFNVFGHLFQFINWTNSGFYLVEDLLSE